MSKKHLTFSIVIPNFNGGNFLEETILSVINQNYPAVELFVVDGKSKDNSVDIIKKYAKHITWWVSEKDSGQSEAINKGLKKATGDIVAYINSDDYYKPNAFSMVNRFFNSFSKTDLVYGNIEFYNENNKSTTLRHPEQFNLHKVLQFKQPLTTIPQPTAFWRRNLLQTVGYFEEKFHYIMDLDMWMRIAMNHSIKKIDSVLAVMRIHEDSKTMSSQTKFNNEMRKERLVLRETFFSNPQLPKNILRYKKNNLSQVTYWIAIENAVNENGTIAAEYIKKLIGYNNDFFKKRSRNIIVLFTQTYQKNNRKRGEIIDLLESIIPQETKGLKQFFKETKRIHAHLIYKKDNQIILFTLLHSLPIFLHSPRLVFCRGIYRIALK